MINGLNKLRYLGGEVSTTFFSLELRGVDAESFLHGQTTNNIEKIENAHFQLDTLLDISGRVLCYFWVLKKNEHHYFLLFETQDLAGIGLERLTRFHIAEDFEISAVESKDVVFTFDPQHKYKEIKNEFKGDYFSEECTLSFESFPENNKDLLEALKRLRGFDAATSLNKLITDSILFEIALDLKKGCFLGQETVGKISSRRGAAFYPMALLCEKEIIIHDSSKINSGGKKVGIALGSFKIENKNFILASLLRDFRVEDYKFEAEIDDSLFEFTSKSFPLVSYSQEGKARELYDKGVELFQADHEEEAIEILEVAVKIDPSFEDAYESLGVIYGRHEKFKEAIELMQKLSKVNPKSVMAHTNMSLYYMKIGDIETAEKHKSEATIKSFAYFGDEAKRKKEEEKRTQEKLIERKKREEMFREVLEIDPEDSLALYGLSDIEFEKGNYDLSEDYSRKVLSSNPKYSVAYLLLGKILIQKKNYSEAQEKLSQGIKIASSQGELMPANEMQRLLSNLD